MNSTLLPGSDQDYDKIYSGLGDTLTPTSQDEMFPDRYAKTAFFYTTAKSSTWLRATSKTLKDGCHLLAVSNILIKARMRVKKATMGTRKTAPNQTTGEL